MHVHTYRLIIDIITSVIFRNLDQYKLSANRTCYKGAGIKIFTFVLKLHTLPYLEMEYQFLMFHNNTMYM